MKTKEVIFKEYGNQFKLIVEYGMRKIGDQDPYFSITAELQEKNSKRWNTVSCGCLYDDIINQLPELEPLIKWHLVSENHGPMHYIPNALFWWERSKRSVAESKNDYTPYGSKALENFKSVVVFGAVESDSQYEEMIVNTSYFEPDKIENWLVGRFNKLMEAFYADMKRFEI